MGLKEVYIFTHEPDNIKAPELALYLANQLKKRTDVTCKAPTLPYEEEGQQISLFLSSFSFRLYLFKNLI